MMRKNLFALLFVVLLLAPLTAHAEQKIVEEETISIGQENGEDYTNITNIVQDNTTNEDTWTFRPPGRLLIGMLQESKFQLNYTNSSIYMFVICSKIKFSSQDIISGSSFMIVRTPINYTDDIFGGLVGLSIYEISENRSNESSYNLSYLTYPYKRLVWFGSTTFFSSDPDGTDPDGNSFFVLDNRLYFYVHAPILPQKTYLFSLFAEYNAYKKAEFFITQDDIAQDNIRDTNIQILNTSEQLQKSYNLSIDAGWSFLIRDTTTLAGVATYQTILKAGESYKFRIYLPGEYRNSTSVYQNIMIPFICQSSVAGTIYVYNKDYANNTISSWDIHSSGVNDFFLIHSPDRVNTSDYVEVKIKFDYEVNITFILINPPLLANVNKSFYYSQTFNTDNIIKHTIYFQTYCSYNQSTDWVWEQLNYTSYVELLTQKVEKQKTTAFQRIWTKIKDLKGIGDVINFIIFGISSSSQYARNLFQNTIWQKVIDIKDYIFNMFEPIFNDLFSKLADFGKFIKKWGMKIYKVIKYVVEKLVYFGSIILGLLMLLVEIIVFLILIGIPGIIIYFTYLIANGELNKVLKIINTIIHGYKWTKDNIKW